MSQQLRVPSPRLKAFTVMVAPPYYIGRPYIECDPSEMVRYRRLPSVAQYAKPKLTFIYDSEDDSDETLSIASIQGFFSKRQPLEYRITGISWHTPRFVNSCHIDNFLAVWV
jgi:hypothetical protein